MGYVGSYLWKIRQKVGHDEVMSASTSTIAVQNGKICMVLRKDSETWTFPGGYAELDMDWQENAKRELFEEADLVAKAEDLKPFASISGQKVIYANGDIVRAFTLLFICNNFTEQAFSDNEEITEKRWFAIDEIDSLKTTGYEKILLDAYKGYVETGEFQPIRLEKELTLNLF